MKVERVKIDEDKPFCRIELTRREVRELTVAMGKRVNDNEDDVHYRLYDGLMNLLEGK